MSQAGTVRERLEEVRERIAKAAESVGRRPDEVSLIAVTKTVAPERILEAYQAGQRLFGESRVQEAALKVARLPADIEWHFIGKLQSNKVRKAAGLFQVIHTLESPSQLKEFDKLPAPLDALIEVNLAHEAQKSGVPPESLDEFWELASQCKGVRVRGLMTIGPNLGDPEAMRAFFRELRRLGERFGCEWLSMGMSADFDVAIQEGATHVRVGSALFGERPGCKSEQEDRKSWKIRMPSKSARACFSASSAAVATQRSWTSTRKLRLLPTRRCGPSIVTT